MQDTLGRNIRYLRLSVTDRCNYRCRYCMAEDAAFLPEEALLSLEELEGIARAAVACGVEKIRLTGGEPLMRPGLPELCRRLRALPGLRELVLTTNGSLLPVYAGALRAAGVDRLNISLDTLEEESFGWITRTGRVEQALAGLKAAREAGFSPDKIKLNAVLLGGVNHRQIPALAALAREEGYSVRFIELMPIGEASGWPKERFVPAQAVLKALPELRPAGNEGVTELFSAPGWKGTVGLIHPMSHRFCSDCDRIRVTADGMLKPCLHSAAELPLRGLSGEALEQAIRAGIRTKPEGHRMDGCRPSESARGMNKIGG